MDNRILIAIGFVLLAISCFMFGNLNLNITMNNIILPNIICGFSLGFIFTPLTIVTFQTLRNEQVANATGIFSLLRSIGGSIGVSVVSTMLSRFAQTHQSYMVSHLSPLNPVFQHKVGMLNHFLSMHMNPVVAAHKANYLMYATLLKQSVLWSYIDNFRLYGLLCIILIPTVFIFKDTKVVKSENVADMH
jgi:DHA2 family multidrug resistance protein